MKLEEVQRKAREAFERARRIKEKPVEENREPTAQELKDWEDALAEAERACDEADRMQRQQSLEQRMSAPGTPGDPSLAPDDGGDPDDNEARYRNIGEFVQAVYEGRSAELRDVGLSSASGGGWLVPEVQRTEILMLDPEAEIIAPRALPIPAGDAPDASETWPAYKQGSGGSHAGIDFYWVEEGEEATKSDPAFEGIRLNPHEVVGRLDIPNKLLRNASNASAFFTRVLTSGIRSLRDSVYMTGDGVGKPLGILNAPGRIEIDRKTANKFDFTDIVKMEQALLAEADQGALWTCTKKGMEQLETIQDPSGQYIFGSQDKSQSRPMRLRGRTLIYNTRSPVLGSTGDLALIAPDFYLAKQGYGPVVSVSEHEKFSKNISVLKIVMSLDGQGWVREPLTGEDGSTKMSPYVVLKKK